MAFSLVQRSVRNLSSHFLLFPALLLTGAVLLSGCHPAVTDPNDPKFIVAEKGDWHITEGELETEVSNFLKQHHATPAQVGPAKMPMVRTMALKNMVLKKLMLEKAATMQLTDVDKDEATQLAAITQSIPPGQTLAQQLQAQGLTMDDLKKMIHERVLIQKVLEANAFKNVNPSEQDIDATYLKYKDSFNIPQKVRASRILILVDDKTSPADKAAKKKAIDDARARVAKGEDFGKVAAEVSQDQYSKTRGGDLGYFQKGENPDAGFDDIAFNTKQGVLSPVFLTPLGYQFLKVTAIQPAGVLPESDARGYISSKLREHNMQVQSVEYAKNLLADSAVTYHLILVDPPAQAAAEQGQGGPGSGAPPAGASDASQQQAQPPDQAAPAPSGGQAPQQ